MHEWLQQRIAAEVMNRELLTLPELTPLPIVAQRLVLTGRPDAVVIDRAGRSLGLVCVTEVLRWLEMGIQETPRSTHPTGRFCCDWQVGDRERCPDDAICHYLTTGPRTAGPETTLADLTHLPLQGRHDRVLIVDADHRPLGVVAALDLLACLMEGEEMQEPGEELVHWHWHPGPQGRQPASGPGS